MMHGTFARSVLLLGAAAPVASLAFLSCGLSSSGTAGGDAGPDAMLSCTSGLGGASATCSGNTATTCARSSDDGGGVVTVDCAAQGKVCVDGVGCAVCAPGQSTCTAGQAKYCRADGSGYVEFACDPVQGMTCDPTGCKGACADAAYTQSYVGCDYYPTVTPNPVWSGFSFAVAVANAGSAAADVTITRGATSVAHQTVASGSLALVPLPWVADLKGGDVDACQNPPDPGVTRVVAGGAYRLRSTSPVSVYQLSPLDYQLTPAPAGCPVPTQCGGPLSDCLSYSNDASLLLPAPALTADYSALTWASSPRRAGFVAITAIEDGTVVQLSPGGELAPGAGLAADGSGQVTLGAGDVLAVLSRHDQSSGYGADLSGTRIHASHPVQVIAGHSCANVPTADTGYCDHLEEAMFPDETLAKDYLVTFPSAEVGDSPHEIRVAATLPGTHVHFDPAVVPDAVLDPGAAPLSITNVIYDVSVHADQPILVAQYMPGSTSLPLPVGSGDPSLSLAVPTAQFRTSYVFVAPHTYFANFVNVIAPSGVAVTLDGAAVPSSEFAAIGGSGYTVARHKLSQTDVHTISSEKPFGIVVYGYGKQTSYMYPGGLDLKAVSAPPPPIK